MNESRTTLYIFGLIVLAIFMGVALGATTAGPFQGRVATNTIPLTTAQPAVSPRSLTLVEAWDIITAQVQVWRPNSTIVTINSIDHAEDSASTGRDGRRRSWQAVAVEGIDQGKAGLWVILEDGKIIEMDEQAGGGGIPAMDNRPALDSPEALQYAIEMKPSLKGADGKGKGYHFSYGYSTEMASTVIGISGATANMPALVMLDPRTKEVVSARSQFFSGGGVLFSTDSGMTWNASDLVGNGQMIKAVAVDPKRENQGYAAGVQGDHIVVYATQDGGRTWQRVSTLPVEAGYWPFDLRALATSDQSTTLLIGTHTGLWASREGTEVWSHLTGLPDGVVQWLGLIQTQVSYRVLVSISLGEKPGLYSSQDLQNWQAVVEEGGYRLSESFDRQFVLATNEEKPGSSLLLDGSGQTNFATPDRTLRAAGDFRRPASTIACANQGVGNLSPQKDAWNGSLYCASLAASPDFEASGIVVLGGFRTGIFWSGDAGQTWQQVLADPSGIIQGNNEIKVLFLSSKDVIAVNGGFLTWKDF